MELSRTDKIIKALQRTQTNKEPFVNLTKRLSIRGKRKKVMKGQREEGRRKKGKKERIRKERNRVAYSTWERRVYRMTPIAPASPMIELIKGARVANPKITTNVGIFST